MKRYSALAVILALFLLLAAPATAQFNSNQNAGTAGGTANAIVLTVPNWARNLVNVPLYFIPASDNTGATTLIVNSVGVATAVQKLGNNGLTALSGGEFRSGQTTAVMWDGTRWVLNQPLGQFVHASDYATSALSFGFAVNLQIDATVSTNALTIALKAAGTGAAPTASTPILIPFRDSTIANGVPKVVSVTSALSLTIASSSTMGCISGQMCRLWIVAICASGLSCTGSAGTDTVALCAFNAFNGTSSIAPINEAALQTSQSGTSGGNSAQAYYCSTSSVTARAIRILGYVDFKEPVAGTWATGPTYTQLFGPGIRKPSEIVQTVTTSSTTQASTTATSYAALTGGTSLAITPTSQANPVLATVNGTMGINNGNSGTVSLVRGAGRVGNPVVASTVGSSGTGQDQFNVTIRVFDVPAADTSTTYSLQGFSSSGANTMTFPITGTGITFDLMEIMGALPEPANDNGLLSMVG